eukprot:3526549-Alexandrium_andersonii.AAC.1
MLPHRAPADQRIPCTRNANPGSEVAKHHRRGPSGEAMSGLGAPEAVGGNLWARAEGRRGARGANVAPKQQTGRPDRSPRSTSCEALRGLGRHCPSGASAPRVCLCKNELPAGKQERAATAASETGSMASKSDTRTRTSIKARCIVESKKVKRGKHERQAREASKRGKREQQAREAIAESRAEGRIKSEVGKSATRCTR